MSDHFDRFPNFLKERIHAEGWRGWRPVQEQAFDALFESDSHLLISAGTSSGKTEAAMIPVICSLHDEPPKGIGALYVGPTKALIDDQFVRMDRLLRDSNIKVSGWHGEVTRTVKEKLRQDPKGILQITPESLQGIVCSGPDLLRDMFPELRFVIIDEVHSFMASERGLQLLCELETIERVSGCHPRRIGLSATLSDTVSAEEWLAAGTGRQTKVARQSDDSDYRFGIKFFRIPADKQERGKAVLAYYKELFRLTDGRACIVFANSRISAENTARSLSKVSESLGSSNPVRIHHGSISGSLRKQAESDLKVAERPTVVATSTLELGMDVGSLDRVVQIGAPYTCSSMMQRMGRSGRRGGGREMIVICLADEDKWDPSPPGMSLDLIRAIAVADLALNEGWIEPIRQNPLPFGLLYHQILAYLKGAGHDVCWQELHSTLLGMWAFRNISYEEMLELSRHMLSTGHLQRMEDGTLLIGLKAEPIANGKDFPSVFEAPAETAVRTSEGIIGTVQGSPKPGKTISLAGRIWKVEKVMSGMIEVSEVSGDAVADSKWESPPPEMDDRVAERMLAILNSNESFRWLDESASAELERTREAFREGGYTGPVETQRGYMVFPWKGTRRFEGLRRLLINTESATVPMCASPYWMDVRTDEEWRYLEHDMEAMRDIDPEDLVLMEDVEDMGKFEKYVPEGLRAREFAALRLSTDVLEADH